MTFKEKLKCQCQIIKAQTKKQQFVLIQNLQQKRRRFAAAMIELFYSVILKVQMSLLGPNFKLLCFSKRG